MELDVSIQYKCTKVIVIKCRDGKKKAKGPPGGREGDL